MRNITPALNYGKEDQDKAQTEEEEKPCGSRIL